MKEIHVHLVHKHSISRKHPLGMKVHTEIFFLMTNRITVLKIKTMF